VLKRTGKWTGDRTKTPLRRVWFPFLSGPIFTSRQKKNQYSIVEDGEDFGVNGGAKERDGKKKKESRA